MMTETIWWHDVGHGEMQTFPALEARNKTRIVSWTFTSSLRILTILKPALRILEIQWNSCHVVPKSSKRSMCLTQHSRAKLSTASTNLKLFQSARAAYPRPSSSWRRYRLGVGPCPISTFLDKDGFAAMKKAELTLDVWRFDYEPRQAGAFELAEKACHVTIFSTFLHFHRFSGVVVCQDTWQKPKSLSEFGNQITTASFDCWGSRWLTFRRLTGSPLKFRRFRHICLTTSYGTIDDYGNAFYGSPNVAVSTWCHPGVTMVRLWRIFLRFFPVTSDICAQDLQGESLKDILSQAEQRFVCLAPGRKNPFFEICRICHILTQMMRMHFDPNTECHIWPVLGQTIWDLETPYLKKPFRSIWNERIAWTSSKCLKAKRISTHKLRFESTKITWRTPDWAWIFFRSVQQFRSFAFQNSTFLKLCSGWCLRTKCEPL